MNPTKRLLQFFEYEHLPPKLQEVSRPVCELARKMAAELPESPETTVGLRKLLEAKDCFVRSALEPKHVVPPPPDLPPPLPPKVIE